MGRSTRPTARAKRLVAAAEALRDAVAAYPAATPQGKVDCILNPLDYAWEPHRAYLERHTPAGPVEAVFVGMNPGPWGMAQTGVPFGSPDLVERFLGIRGTVRPPERCHPKRPIMGFDSHRTEVSGQRLWGGVEACFGQPAAFFRRFMILNFCPLVFQSDTGANVTPDKVPKELMGDCFAACDRHAAEAVAALGPRTVIGVGKWAEARMRRVVEERGLGVEVACILHPSPASPAANRNWLGTVRAQLEELGHPWPEPQA